MITKAVLKLRQKNQCLLFVYKDTGCGMSTEHKEKMFAPFFTTKRGQGASGLGMHVVFNLVTQSLQGTINCLSRLDNGIQFF
jgi:signal transduction histidine kinase